MSVSAVHLFAEARKTSSVVIFGIINAASGVDPCLEMAGQHLEAGADALELRVLDGSRKNSDVNASTMEILAALEQRFPDCLVFLGETTSQRGNLAAGNVVLRRRKGGQDLVIDEASNEVIARSLEVADPTFESVLAAVKAAPSHEVLPLHVSLPPVAADAGSTRLEAMVATQVALLILSGASVISVHEVRSAVKARDEIVKIRHAS